MSDSSGSRSVLISLLTALLTVPLGALIGVLTWRERRRIKEEDSFIESFDADTDPYPPVDPDSSFPDGPFPDRDFCDFEDYEPHPSELLDLECHLCGEVNEVHIDNQAPVCERCENDLDHPYW